MLAFSASKDARSWLVPPSMYGTLTMLDVSHAASPGEHEERVLLWARSVWQVWRAHHQTVAEWCRNL